IPAPRCGRRARGVPPAPRRVARPAPRPARDRLAAGRAAPGTRPADDRRLRVDHGVARRQSPRPARTSTGGQGLMPTMEEYGKQPVAQRMQRLERTAEDLAAAIRGQSDAALSRRPDARSWAAKEVLCHLRDTEEN